MKFQRKYRKSFSHYGFFFTHSACSPDDKSSIIIMVEIRWGVCHCDDVNYSDKTKLMKEEVYLLSRVMLADNQVNPIHHNYMHVRWWWRSHSATTLKRKVFNGNNLKQFIIIKALLCVKERRNFLLLHIFIRLSIQDVLNPDEFISLNIVCCRVEQTPPKSSSSEM